MRDFPKSAEVAPRHGQEGCIVYQVYSSILRGKYAVMVPLNMAQIRRIRDFLNDTLQDGRHVEFTIGMNPTETLIIPKKSKQQVLIDLTRVLGEEHLMVAGPRYKERKKPMFRDMAIETQRLFTLEYCMDNTGKRSARLSTGYSFKYYEDINDISSLIDQVQRRLELGKGMAIDVDERRLVIDGDSLRELLGRLNYIYNRWWFDELRRSA